MNTSAQTVNRRHTRILRASMVLIASIAAAALLALSLAGCPSPKATVPDVTGLLQEAAQQALADAGLSVGTVTEAAGMEHLVGEVTAQSPQAGQEVKKGSSVALTVCSGPEPIPLTTWNATVQLPAGAKTALNSLTVQSGMGEYPVNATGAVQLNAYSTGPILVFVMTPAGNPALMGWTDDTDGTLSVRTTAEALVYLAGGCAGLPLDSRATALELLRTEDLSPLEAAIATQLTDSIDAFAAYNEPVALALADLVADLRSEMQQKLMQISPSSDQSGVQVEHTAQVNSIRLTNMYRRPVKVYIDQVSYVPTGGGAAIDSYKKFKAFDLPSVVPLGGVLNTLINLLSGVYAYEYTHSDIIRLPVGSGHAQTNYELITVAMGSGLGDLNNLSGDRKKDALYSGVLFLLSDFVWPIYSGVVMPIIGYGGSEAINWNEYEGLPVYIDVVNTILGLDGLPQAIWEGRTTDAAILMLNAAVQHPGLQTLMVELAGRSVAKLTGEPFSAIHGEGARAMGAAQQFLNAVAIVDIIFNSADIIRAAHDVGLSNWADTWEINVLKPKVEIAPETVTLASTDTYGQSQAFTVNVPEATGSVGTPSTFAYTYTFTQSVGFIPGHTGVSTFDSSSNTITYTAYADSEGTDTITVDVTEVIVDGSGTRREYVGDATATITVKRVDDPEPFYGSTYSWYEITQAPPGSYHTWLTSWQVGVEFDKIATEPAPRKYAVYGYGFNDTSYHGESVYFVGPPWPCYAGCGEDTGATWRIGLTGGGSGGGTEPSEDELIEIVNWGLSRFEGAIWEITPIY